MVTSHTVAASATTTSSTIATATTRTAGSTDKGSAVDFDSSNNEFYTKLCIQVVESAKRRQDWPAQKIYVEIDKAQIGKKAGILLWKGCTKKDQDSFYLIRSIIKEEYDKKIIEMRNDDQDTKCDISNTCTKNEKQQQQQQHKMMMIQQREIQIPNIIHSTFLRFGGNPCADGKVIQKRFQTLVQDKIKTILGGGVLCIDTIRLVVEKRAYMHIPCDEEHVLSSIDLK